MLLHALALALVHSVWQGFAIGAACAVALWVVPNRPTARHAIAMTGLVAQLVLFVGVFGQALWSEVPAPTLITGTRVLQAAAPPDWTLWMVSAWGLGVVAMAARLGLGVHETRRLRRTVRDLPLEVVDQLQSLAHQLGLPHIRAGLSDAVAGPQVVGVVSPILLIPTATLVCLSPAQLRAVLAHELAHLARHDPFTQAAREAITMLFFHHPVTWWLSRTARQSCEHACDDVAAELVGKKAIASALFELESYRTHALALGASGELSSRIQRLVRPPVRSQPRAAGAFAAAALMMVVAAPALANDRAAERQFHRLERKTDRYLDLSIQGLDTPTQGNMTPEQREAFDASLFEALMAKADALEEIEAAAVRVVELESTVWSAAATTELGSAYEDMGAALEGSTVPPYLDDAQVVAYRAALQTKADLMYDKALAAYEKAADMPGASEWSTTARERIDALEAARDADASDTLDCDSALSVTEACSEE